ncbi:MULTISPECIES: DUF5996 family protein [unclassified Brevundimonas]|uniref:DUF5996 family protein n=1 Tax=unclassified Brevundimonas TaxID=2622653 RepID=UPI003F8F224D
MRPHANAQVWPELSAASLWPTMETLQLWAQVVGKVRLSQTPWLNHGWHVTLRVSARGLATGLIPHGAVGFEMEFDFIASELVIRVSDGGERRIALKPRAVADFYAEVMGALATLGVACRIDLTPDEMAEATPFPADTRHREYDAAVARDYWRALVQVDRVLNGFRTRFLGKCSPVHLFWGAFDLAVTRFSGRRAPLHPGGVPHLPDAVTREAYSHEVSSAGFWPGDPGRGPCFYAYAYPAPPGFDAAAVQPAAARWDAGLGEFLLPYEAVRTAADPDAVLSAFLESTYEAAADLGGWDRAGLECAEGRPRHPRWVG